MMQPVHHVSEQVSTISSGQTLVAVVHGAARFNSKPPVKAAFHC